MDQLSFDKIKLRKDNPILISNSLKVCRAQYGADEILEVVPYKKYVCVLPFTLDEQSKLKSLFLLNKKSAFSDGVCLTMPIIENDDSIDDSNLYTAIRLVNICMGGKVDDSDLDKLIYIGDMEFNTILKCSIPCYGIDLSNIKRNVDRYRMNDYSMLVERQYEEIAKNGNQDAMVFAALYMLLTYFS